MPIQNMSMHDPDLHLFVNDDTILARRDMPRLVQTLRRETAAPVLAPEGDEGTTIGYSSVMYDADTGDLKAWYTSMAEDRLRLAVSRDGLEWKRCGAVLQQQEETQIDNVCIAPAGKRLAPWFDGSRAVGICVFSEPPKPGHQPGIYAVRSPDGERLEVRYPGILPGKGDRSYLCYDQVEDEYLFITRPYYGYIPGFTPVHNVEVVRHRMARMWKSSDMLTWDDCGIVLRYDDTDPPDLQIYGMQPFRYGRGFLALVEMYRQAMERLDTQLAWSDDGLHWERVGQREAVLPLGGAGAWDSHWVVPTSNAPIPRGDRILVPYRGASTKHASGRRHHGGIGLASVRKDGWVSLEAGRVEGVLVTQELPLTEPMQLELNVDCRSGYAAVDVIADEPEKHFEPIPGYDAGTSRIEHADAVRHAVTWGDRTVVQPHSSGSCFLRITMKQGSLFSFRWSQPSRVRQLSGTGTGR